MTTVETKAWLAGRKEAGKRIDPGACEVQWTWAGVLDPCGVLHLEEDNIDRVYFVRSLKLGDLPEETHEALRARFERRGLSDDES